MSDNALSGMRSANRMGVADTGDLMPLIPTKIQVPHRRPNVLARQRLVNFLHDHIDRKLILISAPAGYGKTTMLAQFAEETDLPVCWYTLDPFDQDLRVFLEYLIASISHRFPSFGARTRARLREIADPASNLHAVAASLVQEIYDTIPEYFLLILDDHHTVENQGQISELLDLFVNYVDENCHVILASRTLPVLPNLSLLVARRQAAGISMDELRFTPQEIRSLAEQVYGLKLSLEEADTLAQRTGGWITGLLLTAAPRWTQARSDVPLRGRIGIDLYDYLSRQVLEQQPPELRQFLLTSSVLDELSPELCTAVLGISGVESLIEQVRGRNLFVTEFGEGVNRLRYQDLFRDFLQTSLRRLDEAHFSDLFRRAAQVYASQGEWEQSVSRYLAIREYECVAGILEQIGNRLYDSGRWDTLANWIDALPPAVREKRPQLLVNRGKIHAERSEYGQALALLERARQAFSESGDQASEAFVLATKGSPLRFLGRCAEVVDHCQRALALVSGATSHEKAAMALAHKNIGLCQLNSGQLAEGRETLQQARRLYEEIGEVYNLAMVEHDLGLSHERAGELDWAIVHYRAALQSWQELGNPAPWANTLNGLGVVYYAQGRYAEALPILNEALAKAQQAGDLRVQAYTLASLGDLQRDLGAYDQASDAYAQALEVAHSGRSGFIIAYALDGLGNTLRLQGDLAASRKQLLRAMEQAQADQSEYETALCHTSLGILAAREGDVIAARRHLDQAVEVFGASGFHQELGRACLYRAQVAYQSGQPEAAFADLERTLELSAQLGLDQFLVVNGQFLAPLLRFALKEGVGAAVLPGLLERIEAHRSQVAAVPETAIPARVQPSLRIYALGQALVEANGGSVKWTTAQSRDLFFYLLQRPQGVRKEKIAEIFWPDHTPHKLEGIFRSTLYRLRRALFRQSVVYEDDLYRFNRSTDYWFDVEAFEELADRAGQPEQSEGLVGLLEEAVSLYHGDYLEGIYADWAVLERERLRGRYLGALEKLAGLYADSSSDRSAEGAARAIELYQRLLSLEPYRENAHRQLMRCYRRLGDRAAAIRQYQLCVEVLRDDLGLSPTPETEEVYMQIIS